MRRMYVSTVFMLMSSFFATALYIAPAASNSSTSRSRGASGSGGGSDRSASNDRTILRVSVAGNGPAVVSLRVKAASPGEGRIEWLLPKAPPAEVKSVPFALAGGAWQDITVSVPAAGPFGILRVYLPAANQPVDVDWIEFGKGKPATSRRWDF